MLSSQHLDQKVHQHVKSFFAKQHSKCDSYFSEITWFYIILWLYYRIWTRCNASLSCVIHIKICFHVWNLVEFKTITKAVLSLCFIFCGKTSIQNSFLQLTNISIVLIHIGFQDLKQKIYEGCIYQLEVYKVN